ncbi:hypothetical protein [Mesorhizobium sp. M0590]
MAISDVGTEHPITEFSIGGGRDAQFSNAGWAGLIVRWTAWISDE